MTEDKLFNVHLEQLGVGIVKAENLKEAIVYIEREYPEENILGIDESPRKLL